MHYFAYASNLSPRQMAERCPGHVVIGVASLADYRLEFKGLSECWGGAVATLVPTHGGVVWGALYELTDEHFACMDRNEGFRGPGDEHNQYQRSWVTVDLVRPLDGSVPRRVRAQTYFGLHGNAGPPSQRYLDTILEGARHHRLPEEYVERLSRTPVVSAGA